MLYQKLWVIKHAKKNSDESLLFDTITAFVLYFQG